MHGAVVLKTVEIPQLQFLDLVAVPVRATTSVGTDSAENCGIAEGAAPVVLWTLLCSYSVCSSSPCRTVLARFSSLDRMPDIPVVPQQFLNKVVDACAHGSDSARQLFTDKVVDIPVLALRTGGASDSVIDRVQ